MGAHPPSPRPKDAGLGVAVGQQALGLALTGVSQLKPRSWESVAFGLLSTPLQVGHW